MNQLEPVLEKVGRVLADQYGIRVRCEGQRCCTDGNVIYLPSLPDDIPDELRDTIRGFLDHECGHVAAASSFPVGTVFRKKFGDEAFVLLNCMEDLRIEAFMRRRYPGSAVNLMNAYRYAIKAATEKATAGEVMAPMKRIAFAIGTRGAKLPDLPFVDKDAYAVMDRIANEIRQAATAPNTKAVAKLAESAWAQVMPMFRRRATVFRRCRRLAGTARNLRPRRNAVGEKTNQGMVRRPSRQRVIHRPAPPVIRRAIPRTTGMPGSSPDWGGTSPPPSPAMPGPEVFTEHGVRPTTRSLKWSTDPRPRTRSAWRRSCATSPGCVNDCCKR